MKRKIIALAMLLRPARISETAYLLLRDEAISGKLIIAATLLALIAANTVFAPLYETIWQTHLSIGLGGWSIDKDLRHWVNDGLMTIFFLVVGLELKRELVQGELRKFRTAVLPFAAAVGGMIAPALIYLVFNFGSEAASGWAIPMATDIAIAIGILAIAGKSIPVSIRLFLLTLAIVDDVGAVVVIAIFYSHSINLWLLGLVAATCLTLGLVARYRGLPMSVYIFGSLLIWLAIDASGVHASIAGILIGMLAPLAKTNFSKRSISERTEHAMIPVSAFVIVPLFAFANTGVLLSVGELFGSSTLPVVLGVGLGLIVGKVVGIIGASWLMIKLNLSDLPVGAHWNHMIGIGLLAGIGFTVSILVTELAFDNQQFILASKLSIFVASLICGLIGLIVLRHSRTTQWVRR